MITVIAGTFLGLALIIWISSGGPTSAQQLEWYNIPQYLVENEQQVLKARVDDMDLFVEINDDGTRRDGFAEYLVQSIKDTFKLEVYPRDVVLFTPGLKKVIGRAKF